ncbi:MAG: DNA polymerase/3'-5' exonuclease PolX, partial [Candidatus Goldbacteria bacterium]|nr:DNA polymerase/3'-5' exonuclease PolX [Candidatus Goldiibacteriota bacterium]
FQDELMTNHQIISVLNEIAELLTVKGENKFKIRAYEKLARFLSSYPHELKDIYKEKGIKGLTDIPNIGEGIAKKIAELIDTGKLSYLEELKKSLPENIDMLLKIPGMGPKTAFLLGDKFKIKTISQLEKFLISGKLREIKGYGEKIEQKLLKGIELYKKGEKRKLLGEAYPLAMKIINRLKEKVKIDFITPAGSLRRMEDTIGDIDILAVCKDRKKLMDEFTSLDFVDRVLAKGDKKSSVYLLDGIQADIRVFDKDEIGAALQYFTGNKEHNVLIREIAVKKGFTLNEYGLFKGDKKIAGEKEEDIYEKLGLSYIPPELRLGGEEIKMASDKKIPKLVELKEIKGDFHIHSNYSDGRNDIETLAKEAIKRGYLFIAITDHSSSLKVARGLSVENLEKQWNEIERINKKYKDKILILKGIESDILPDGNLDYPDEILRQFDFVIGSVHTQFKMNKKEMTERILKAMDNKYLHCIGHISGRMINIREPYEIDYIEIFKKAAKKKIALEINAQPERLDITDIYIKEALKYGVKFIIGTDSHVAESFDYIIYGVGKARRGWLEKEDVINTYTSEKLVKWLKKK